MCYSAMIKRDISYLHQKYGATLVREQLEDFAELTFAARIFPGSAAPIVTNDPKDNRIIQIMRYSVTPPSFISDPSKYSTFNARSDNLTSRFWSEAYMAHHGIIEMDSFFEWVEVKDLV